MADAKSGPAGERWGLISIYVKVICFRDAEAETEVVGVLSYNRSEENGHYII